ncbi:MAG: hypothetical protein HC852_11540 [Acaryochloridaceae cyanobacterium RU_4_10]|nr:hypothetical protein [Acaryochloridaceae cyanobacterium RU_4_10]
MRSPKGWPEKYWNCGKYPKGTGFKNNFSEGPTFSTAQTDGDRNDPQNGEKKGDRNFASTVIGLGFNKGVGLQQFTF